MKTTTDQKQSLIREINRLAAYTFILMLPMSIYFPFEATNIASLVPDLYVRPGLYLIDIVVIVFLITSVLGEVRYSWKPDSPYFLFLMGLVILALFTAPTAFVPSLAGYMAFRWFIAVLVFLSLVQSSIPIDELVTVFISGLLLHVLVGIGQFINGAPLGIPGELALRPGLPGVALVVIDGSTTLRGYGLTFNPNVLGGFLSVALFACLPLLRRFYFVLIWWTLWIGLILTFSRSAWLAVGFFLPVAIVWFFRKRPTIRKPLTIALAGPALILLVTVFTFSDTLISRLQPLLTEGERLNLVHRIDLWNVSIKIARENPLSGVGAGNFPLAIPLYEPTIRPDHAHNVPLQLAAETGYLGGFIWLTMLLTPILEMWNSKGFQDEWALVFTFAWLGLGLISFFDGYLWILNAGRLLTVTTLAFLGRTKMMIRNKAS